MTAATHNSNDPNLLGPEKLREFAENHAMQGIDPENPDAAPGTRAHHLLFAIYVEIRRLADILTTET